MTPTEVITSGGIQSQRHSLTSVYGTSLAGGVLACVTAFDAGTGAQAGTSDCEPQGTLAYHPHNATLRFAFIYPYPAITIPGSGYFTY
jgi:hypothetical protein